MKRSSPNTSICKRRPLSGAKQLSAYFDRRNELLGKALHAAHQYFSVEGIHDMRVEIKRFRILYELVDFISPSFTSKPNYSLLKGLFRSAGELRDIDICQAIVLPHLKTLDLREYYNYLKKEELQRRNSFRDIATSFSVVALAESGRLIYSALAITREALLKKRIEKKIIKLAGEVNDLLTHKGLNNNRLHMMRKISKALRYILDIRQECYGEKEPATAAIDRLKKAYDCLGKWHDTSIARESLSAFIEKEMQNVTDPAAYTTFQDDLRRKEKWLLAVYEQSKKPLRASLEQLTLTLQKKTPIYEEQPNTNSCIRAVPFRSSRE
jgi:CHAD domain-containing protein